MKSILILSILLFSLNSLAGIGDSNYFNFLSSYQINPSVQNCTLSEIRSDLKDIVTEYINLGYVKTKVDAAYDESFYFPSQQSLVAATPGIKSKLDQACKKYAANKPSSTSNIQSATSNSNGNKPTNSATPPTVPTVPASSFTSLNNTNQNNGSSTNNGSNTSGNKDTTCQYGSTQCLGINAQNNNTKAKTASGEDNGYSYTTNDYGKDKTAKVNDVNGNSLIARTTTDDKGKQKTEFEALDIDGKKINVNSLPKEMKDKAKKLAEVTGENAENIPDTEKGKKHKETAKNKADKSKSENERLNAVNSEISSEIKKCTDISGCTEASTKTDDVKDFIHSAQAEQTKCDGSASKAHFLCPTATNPQVQAVGTLMNGMAAMIPSISSAKETCAATSSVNLIGQTVLGVATAVCAGVKTSCETKCAKTNSKYKEVTTAYDQINESLSAALKEAQAEKRKAEDEKKDAEKDQDALGASYAQAKIDTQTRNIAAIEKAQGKTPEIDQIITKQSGENSADIAKCEGYKVDIAQIGTTAMNMMAASLQAKKCEEQLSAQNGNGTGNTPQTYTMDEMCAQPQNATSSICKCRSDNTAVGCPGHIAGSGNEGNINKTINSPGLAAMAGFGPKVKPSSAFSSGTDLGGLSDEAKVALAANGEQKPSTSMFDQAGGANAGGGGSTSASGAAAGGAKGKVAEESKSMGSSFVNAVSSFFKGGSGGKSTAAKDDKFNADKYKEKIKRQIAAEQMRSEVSSASGMDNWTKIKSRYKSNSSSLIESN